MKPTFNFLINHKMLPGRITIGKYDGKNACLTAATIADKVPMQLQIILDIQ